MGAQLLSSNSVEVTLKNRNFPFLQNPEKKAKHLKSFAFYEGDNQVYRKELAYSIQQCLEDLDSDNDIVEINMIDSNPANNPQPPKRVG